ncbi:MBL fold metallo-hydrolase [Pararhizobium mangrovi]|uniref:MBL fold metallo-hydrolase n=1 Tax=Pararhizobium mangrovi TaxID=2590452 RepID=A0A506UD51_9HYPH|nr:MBL fold metallo-hydrolase [Pararhizobium mangrovi]TPW31336.1 MBL fold metallo-hydrolase [Pararhizobium mangrovi]
MKVRRRFTILGCSSSPGVPRITGDWGACDPNEPKNRRSRSSMLVEQIAADGASTSVIIDTGPDFHGQMVAAGVTRIDGVVYTHPHADHIHGIDDLRGFAIEMRTRVPIHAERHTLDRLYEAFRYCFETPEGSAYPPILDAHEIPPSWPDVTIEGPGGPIVLRPLEQIHGDIRSLGYRIGDVAYCCDVSDFPNETIAKLGDLDVLVIDALQKREHPSHLSLDQALGWIERLGARRAYLTHMHTPLDYAVAMAETPEHVEPAYDQLVFERDVEL